MQTILVPTDFSDNAKNALNYAAQLAKRLNARLVLFHGYMLPTPVSEVPYVMINAEEIQKENEAAAKDAVTKVAQEFGIETDYIVRLGFPSDEIEVILEDHPIDLIVMGMKGRGTLEKMMGSTTTAVIKKVKKPVLVVPEEASYNGLQKIAYATDFSYTADANVYDSLLQLINTFNAELNVLHVQKKSYGADSGDSRQPMPAFEGIPHEFHLVTDTDVKHGIETYLQQNPTSLLVMVTHEHSFMERLFGKSHTKAMVYDTHVPLLVLRDKK